MRLEAVQKLIGLLLMAFSISMLPPIGVSLYYHDGATGHFVTSLILMLGIGTVLWLPVRRTVRELHTRDGFIVVSLFWTVLGMLSAIPFVLSPHLSFTDAVFESVSGFTTTGATVITGLDTLPRSILYYRQQLNWLGGMGVVVLAVAILPMIGVGGMQLFRAETPGPMKEEKLTPRIAGTARALWVIYVGLTAAFALAFWLAGMTPFDAIGHSFSAISTGGFSPHDASFAYFNSPLIEAIADLEMLAGAINFAVHFQVLRSRRPGIYLRNTESRFFLAVVAAVVAVVAFELWLHGEYRSPLTALRYAAFQVCSVISSTGFTTANFSLWPSFVPILLIYISFIGGSAGSTAGGIKAVRIELLLKQLLREIKQLVHPRSIAAVLVGGKPMPERVVSAVWGFFALYVFGTSTLTLLMMASGLDAVSAFSSVAACLNNLGPGLGEVAGNYAGVSTVGKWILTFAMLLGRLEIFTLFVLLTPAYWRK